MTRVNPRIEPDQRRVVSPRGRASPSARSRGALSSLFTLCAVLTACEASQPGELEKTVAPTSARSSSAALEALAESPVSPVPVANAWEPHSAIAAGNGIYLVVWTERSSQTGGADILGVRINALDGTSLDASPLPIATGPVDQTAPAVAFDGNNFLVVWEQNTQYGDHFIHGTRVRASDGAVLDTPFVISHIPDGRYGTYPQNRPAVAFDGTNYLVIWEGVTPRSTIYDYALAIQGTRVRASDGTCIESTRFIIAAPVGTIDLPLGVRARVAYADGNYLVTWAKDGNLLAARVQAQDGQVLDTNPITVSSSGSFPAVASRSGEFLVVWYGGATLRARRLNSSSGALLDSTDIVVGQNPVGLPEVTFDGQDYRFIWESVRGGMGLKYVASQMSTQGTVTAGAEVELSNLSMNTALERGAIAAAAPGLVLTTYYEADPVTSMTRTMRRVLKEPQACESQAPTLTLTGAAELTLECGSGPYNDPGAQAVDGCGSSLVVRGYNTGHDSSGPGPNPSLEGTYQMSYAAWGANGLTATASRTVIVDDRTAPTLTLLGSATMTHTCGSQWVDPGVTATDACYGNLTPQVWKTGEVNGWAVGTYTVTYTVTDSGGNSATPVTRTVNVVNCPW
ncbi:DUF5011 domain-containing protein [Hyalangium versicolor]|uniref:DUF5011 domain-containing protein n=1 Tax=Hyalangium versicolor TaxID=2861190 RepID=UPI001CCA7706|nr:DUF5011 domain-containing protein [Hyalangium versicolor]